MPARKLVFSMIASVLVVLVATACSSTRSPTAGSRPAGAAPSGSANASTIAGAAPTAAAGGGPFCEVVKSSQEAMRPLSRDLFKNPANTKASWDGIMAQWNRMAAAAPPEVRDDFRVIVDSWNRAGDEAAKGGWDIVTLIRALAKQMDADTFQQAYVHRAQYIHDRCGFDPFDPGASQ
jgi:hypothetical protein